MSKQLVIREFGFVQLLKVATRVFEQYRTDQPKMWARMDGTPILNDVAVRMAEAFGKAFRCEAFCGVHAEMDEKGTLAPFKNCLACIRNENAELRAELKDEQRHRGDMTFEQATSGDE